MHWSNRGVGNKGPTVTSPPPMPPTARVEEDVRLSRFTAPHTLSRMSSTPFTDAPARSSPLPDDSTIPMPPHLVGQCSTSTTAASSTTNQFHHPSTHQHPFPPMQRRDAVAIAGAHTASATTSGVVHTGTRTIFAGGPSSIGAALSTASGVSHPFTSNMLASSQSLHLTLTSSAVTMDAEEEELYMLLKEFTTAVEKESSSVSQTMADVIDVIERRSQSLLDPMARDMFVEHCLRDLIMHLISLNTTVSLMAAVHVLELLLPIRYTTASNKFVRICRSLSAIMQNPNPTLWKEAQRVYGLMLLYDRAYDLGEPPLKGYLSKELREQVGNANVHLQSHSAHNRKQPPPQLMYFLLSIQVIAEVNPSYVAVVSLRDDIIRIATSCCVSEQPLETIAYQCLVALFKASSGLNPKDIIRENKAICSKCEHLNSSRFNEVSLICQLKVLRALFSSRPYIISGGEKIAAAVTSQFSPGKSPEVRIAVCDLLPVIAPMDISNPSRRNAYCAYIMEPLKNLRDNRRKGEELSNIAYFIAAVGYHVLDAASKNNLDSILLRYISMPEVQEACWKVIASILTAAQHTNFDHRNRRYRALLINQVSNRISVMNPSRGLLPESMGPLPLAEGATSGGTSSFHRIRSSDGSSRQSPIMSPSMSAPSVPSWVPGRTGSGGLFGEDRMSSHKGSPIGSPYAGPQQRRSIPSFQLPYHDDKKSCALADSESSTASHDLEGTSASHQLPKLSSSLAAHDSISSGTSESSQQRVVSMSMEELVLKCTPYISQACLTSHLVEVLRIVQEAVPAAEKDISIGLAELVDTTLRESSPRDEEEIKSKSAASSFNMVVVSANPVVGTSRFLNAKENGVASVAVLSTVSPVSSTSPSSFTSQTMRSSERVLVSPTPPPAPPNSQSSDSHNGDGESLPLMHLIPQTNGTTRPVGNQKENDLSVALELISQREVQSIVQLEATINAVEPFQSHPNPIIRQLVSQCFIRSIGSWVSYAVERKETTNSNVVVNLLDTYLRLASNELHMRCRKEMIEMLTEEKCLHAYFSDNRLLSLLVSFLSTSPRSRDIAVDMLHIAIPILKPNLLFSMQQAISVLIDAAIISLEYSDDVTTLFTSMDSLRSFTKLGVRFLFVHLSRIFRCLQKRLRDSSVADKVALSILKTLESVLTVLYTDEKAIVRYEDDVNSLYPVVLANLRRSSTQFISLAAVNVLALLNRMSVYPVQLADHHAITQVLTQVYIATHSSRKEVESILTLFGQLGAVSSSSHQDKKPILPSAGSMSSSATSTAISTTQENIKSQQPMNKILSHHSEDAISFDPSSRDYTVVVYKALSRLVDSTHSESVSTQALRTLMQLIRLTQDQKDQIDGTLAAQSLIVIAKRNSSDSPTLRIEALKVLAAVCALRHEKIVRTMLPEIFVLLEQLWCPNDTALFSVVLDVVCALKPGKLSEKEHSESWEWLYPRLMDIAAADQSENRETCLRVVEIVLTASYIPDHCLPIIFPFLQRFMQQSSQLAEVRGQSLCAGVHLVCDLKASQFIAPLMRCIRILSRHCESSSELPVRLAAVSTIESLKMFSALAPSARPAIRSLLDRLTAKHEVGVHRVPSTKTSLYSGMGPSPMGGSVHGLLSNPGGISGERRLSDEEEEEVPIVPAEMPKPDAQDIAVFLKHIEWGATRRKMKEWFAELQKYIIMVSPHPAIRMMTGLVSKHDPLRRELFCPSFKAIYELLTAEQVLKVNLVMTSVLNGNDSELTSQCLALADYLEHQPPRFSNETIAELQNLRSFDESSSNPSSSKEVAFNPFGSSIHFPPSSLVSSTTDAPMDVGRSHADSSASVSVRDGIAVALDSTNTLATGTPRPSHVFQPAMEMDDLPDLSLSDNNLTRPDNGTVLHYLSPTVRVPIDPYPPLGSSDTSLFTPANIIKAVERTRLYDKAVNYFETRLLKSMNQYSFQLPHDVVHSVALPLAWLYNQRDMQSSVIGLFEAIHYNGEIDAGGWFELLGSWENAQRVYAKAITLSGEIPCSTDLNTPPSSKGKLISVLPPTPSIPILEGYIRSLFFCAEWSKVLDVALTASTETLKSSYTISRCGSTAAVVLGRWDVVPGLSSVMSTHTSVNRYSQHFFTHITHLHQAVISKDPQMLDGIRKNVARAKVSMDDSVRALLQLGSSHAYECIVMLQHYTEMEELVDYYTSRTAKRKSQLMERWEARFKRLKVRGPQPTLNTLLLFSVVLSTREFSSMILHFCDMMNGNYPKLTQWAMRWLQEGVPPSAPHDSGPTNPSTPMPLVSSPELYIGYLTHIWSQGRHREAAEQMELYLCENEAALETTKSVVYAAAHLQLGKWRVELLEHSPTRWSSEEVQKQFDHFYRAIRGDPSSYEAWYNWALMNYRVQQNQSPRAENQRQYVEAAHQGFAAAICRCQTPSDALPAIMRLLQLWVIHNGVELLKEMVADIISRIPVDYWVQAIPQLIGHLTNQSHDIREVLSMILSRVATKHPQALIFPLLVVVMSEEDTSTGRPQLRQREIVHSILQHCPKQVRAEAETVAKLLGEVSAIPIEKIREHLSEVASAWNPNSEFEIDRLDVQRRLTAVLEIFNANRRHLLYTVGDIGQYVQIVMEHETAGDVSKALGIVKQLVDEISKHITDKLGKEPQKAMEPLLRLRNLTIAVFGEYSILHPVFPTIAFFSSALELIPSKKRPRKIQLSGSDGRQYAFCLKGNEDIRMDERVMQLFGMVNVLLSHLYSDAYPASIHCFPVIPISSSVGLLGWVQKASTMNSIICDYRTNVSHLRTHQESMVLRSYVESIGHWEKLSIIQRTEALDVVMHTKSCAAMDVANAMWYCSTNAEQWLDRRVTYTTSLATMSMVGYILGLGDRHLGNILLSMSTGKAIHIDFGDSFEVGRIRHVLPETIPFRLTRMLSNAMEVFGVNGSFRASATRTQQVIRGERDSIMSLLSAFVYDPIIHHKGKVKSALVKGRSPKDIRDRIRRKLHGTELAVEDAATYSATAESTRRPDLLFMTRLFDVNAARDPSRVFSTEQQVHYLIDEATRVDNYTVLFVGWGPLW